MGPDRILDKSKIIKMKDKLTKLCSSMGIPVRQLTDERMNIYRSQKFDEEILVNSMTELNKILEGNVITMGGFSACYKLLGFRKMRRVSNDLDCVINEEGLKLLYDHFGDEIFQTKNYGDIFLEYNNIPVGFDLGETHGWIIPPSFFKDLKRFNFNGKKLTSISPEFLITLKARRSILKDKFFGKDAIDTANILLAPYYKDNLNRIDFEKLGDLMRLHSSDSYETIERYINFIESHKIHLKKKELPFFSESLSSLRSSVYNNYK